MSQVFHDLRFDLPKKSEARLREIHAHLESRPDSVAHLTAPRTKDWLALMREQILGAFREGLIATHYHLERVRQLERAIRDRAEANADVLLSTPPTTVGLFCRPLNAEYQAFKFATRRTLEYLARAVAMYFKTDAKSIRNLAAAIEGREPAGRVSRIQARIRAANLPTVIGEGNEKSVRDLLAHHKAVDAGVVNITVTEPGSVLIRVVGGGEQLQPFGDLAENDLSAVLEREVEWLEELSFGLFRELGLLPG